MLQARYCAQPDNAEDYLAQQCASTLETWGSGPAGTLGVQALQQALHSCVAPLGDAAGAALWQAACTIQSCTSCRVGPPCCSVPSLIVMRSMCEFQAVQGVIVLAVKSYEPVLMSVLPSWHLCQDLLPPFFL